MEVGKTYNYVTITQENDKTAGEAYVREYRTFTSDDTHEAKDGYEWKVVELVVEFSDNGEETGNPWRDGVTVSSCSENYYDIIGNDTGEEEVDGYTKRTVTYNGETTVLYRRTKQTINFDGWRNRSEVCRCREEWLVPVGYDGIVLGLYDAGVSWDEEEYIFDVADENTLFFRLDSRPDYCKDYKYVVLDETNVEITEYIGGTTEVKSNKTI